MLICWFWRVPVATISQRLVQPFGNASCHWSICYVCLHPCNFTLETCGLIDQLMMLLQTNLIIDLVGKQQVVGSEAGFRYKPPPHKKRKRKRKRKRRDRHLRSSLVYIWPHQVSTYWANKIMLYFLNIQRAQVKDSCLPYSFIH